MRNFLKEAAEVEIAELEHKVKLIGKILAKCAATLAVSKVYATIAGDKQEMYVIQQYKKAVNGYWTETYGIGKDLNDLKVASEQQPVMVEKNITADINQITKMTNDIAVKIDQVWDKLRKQEFDYQNNPESSSVTAAIVGNAKIIGAKLAKCTGALKVIKLYCILDEAKNKTHITSNKKALDRANQLWNLVNEIASKAFESISIGGHFTTDQIDEIKEKIGTAKDLVNVYERDAQLSWNHFNQYETHPIGNYNEV